MSTSPVVGRDTLTMLHRRLGTGGGCSAVKNAAKDWAMIAKYLRPVESVRLSKAADGGALIQEQP